MFSRWGVVWTSVKLMLDRNFSSDGKEKLLVDENGMSAVQHIKQGVAFRGPCE